MEMIVVAGPDAGKRLVLSAGVVTIGRGATNDLALVDAMVSTRHALVRSLPTGSFELTDLSSTNGTWLDGDRLTAPVEISPISMIQIGENVLQLLEGPRVDSTAALPDATPPRRVDPAQITAHDAGPVAGGDIEMTGRQVAGRDLHYHEGFRIRSRMRRGARRLLRWGIGLFFAGNLIGLGAVIAFQQIIFASTGGLDREFDFTEEATALGIAGAGAFIGFVGIVLIVVSLVMGREQVQEPIVKRRR